VISVLSRNGDASYNRDIDPLPGGAHPIAGGCCSSLTIALEAARGVEVYFDTT